MPTQSDIEHLLRRTEFVARPARVAELLALPTREAVVDNVLGVPADPGSVVLVEPSDWERSEEYTHFWLNRMAHDSPRPIQEKIALLLARALLFRPLQGRDGRADAAADRPVPPPRDGQPALAGEDDVDPGGDDPLPRQQRQPADLAQPELRPRADGAVHARRRQLHRAGRRGVDRGVDRSHRQLGDRRLRVARRLARQHHQDVPRSHDQRRQVAGGPDAARARDDRHDARHRGGAGDGDQRRQPRPRDARCVGRVHLPQAVDCSSPGRRLRRR